MTRPFLRKNSAKGYSRQGSLSLKPLYAFRLLARYDLLGQCHRKSDLIRIFRELIYHDKIREREEEKEER